MNQTIAAYNLTAQEYADKVKDLHPAEEGRYFVSNLGGSKRVLDLGCGSGRDARVFSDAGCQVVGIDLSTELIEIARRNSSRSAFLNLDMLNLPFREGFFDGIWSCASLLHLPKKSLPDCLSQCCHVLKDGGIFYVGVKEGTGEESKPDLRYGPSVAKFYSYFQQGEMESFLTDAGFGIEKSYVYRWPAGSYVQHSEVRIFARKPRTQTLKSLR